MNEAANYLAFITLSEVEEGVLRGGVLVTDSQGKPMEFRCTSPVRPNAVQRTLYGSTLMPHIAVELVGVPLVKSLKCQPSVVLIQNEDFISLRLRFEKPVILARRQGQDIHLSEDGEQSQKEEIIQSASNKFDPVVVTSHWEHPDDIGECREMLGWTFSNCDLVEPFDRIETALTTLHKQGVLAEK